MILIRKRREPRTLQQYKNMIGASYQNMHGAPTGRKRENGEPEDLYEVVLEHLMNEQGRICAYCMRRIPDPKRSPGATIEHIDPQSKTDPKKAMDYNNMLAVCNGNRNARSDDEKTCDAKRGNKQLDLNPLIASTLESIRYRSSGRIYSDNEKIDAQLNNVLNLNCEALNLIKCRKQALNAMLIELDAKHKGDREYYARLLARYENESDLKPPYVGILIWWLKKHTAEF